MARLWSTGFELQSLTAGVEVQTINGSPAINTTIKRGGGAAMRVNPTAAAHYAQHTVRADTNTDIYGRFALYIATAPSAKVPIFSYGDSANFYGAQILLDSTRKLYTNNNGLSLETAGTTVLNTGQWYSITWFYDETNSKLTVKIDGVTEINAATVDDIGGGGRVRFGINTATTADLYFDDIAVNDTVNTPAGNGQTSYPDYRGRIVHMYPDSAGDNAGFTAGAGAGANFARVDEVTPNDATDYVEKTTTGTVIDDHNVASSSSAGIGSGDTITLVEVGLRGGSTATTAGATITPRVKSAASGTVASGLAGAYNVNGWRTNGSASPLPQLIAYTDPTTGIAWTPTGTNSLDNMQIGYTNSASNTTARRVTTVWALVEYIPSATQTITAAGYANTNAYGTAVVSAANTIQGAAYDNSANNGYGAAVVAQVLPLTEQLIDNFDDNVRDTTKWPNTYSSSATLAETGGRVVVTLSAGTPGYAAYVSDNLNFIGSYAQVQVPTVGNPATGADTFMQVVQDSSNYVEFLVEGGTIFARKKVAGSVTNIATATYNSVNHAYWRIRESAGTTYWETSPDGTPGSWTTMTSQSNPITLTSVQINLGGGTYQPETAPGAPTFDNFNVLQSKISAAGYANTSAYGVPEIGRQYIGATGYPNVSSYGQAMVTPGAVNIAAVGYANTSAYGAPAFAINIFASGYVNNSAYGLATITPGPVNIAAVGYANVIGYGVAKVVNLNAIRAVGYANPSAAFGLVTVLRDNLPEATWVKNGVTPAGWVNPAPGNAAWTPANVPVATPWDKNDAL